MKIISLLIGYGLLMSVIVVVFYGNNPIVLNLALIVYLLGLRHALDLDHIATIDNLVRQRIGDKRSANSVGFLFSLGHCTVVILMCVFVALIAQSIKPQINAIFQTGKWIGSVISMTLLFLFSLNTARSLWLPQKEHSQSLHVQPSKLSKFWLKKFPTMLSNPQIYIVGFLFGLSFDTSSEVSLLGLTALQSAEGSAWRTLLLFPALFLAGMCFLDTTIGWVTARICEKVVEKGGNQWNRLITGIIAFFGLIMVIVEITQCFNDA